MSAGDMAMGETAAAEPGVRLIVYLGMWTTMMAAMMLPAAAPMILMFGTVYRSKRERGGRVRADLGLRGRLPGGLGRLRRLRLGGGRTGEGLARDVSLRCGSSPRGWPPWRCWRPRPTSSPR